METRLAATRTWLTAMGSDLGDILPGLSSSPRTGPTQMVNRPAHKNNDEWKKPELCLLAWPPSVTGRAPCASSALSETAFLLVTQTPSHILQRKIRWIHRFQS
ncbi:Hypothetical predicted protein [Podarcis lilfordi]|uniref:Uncharacterized protein n=1 Tax=Podarcis lilfordi TaxID=74358 RepID=A0AA35P5Z4_9SAUR|nr:Hypothetical predicted protein [Podarcis lilfordi]